MRSGKKKTKLPHVCTHLVKLCEEAQEHDLEAKPSKDAERERGPHRPLAPPLHAAFFTLLRALEPRDRVQLRAGTRRGHKCRTG